MSDSLTQQTFLGASIKGFNSSLGWGSQSSNITIDLAEDDVNDDLFVNPGVGRHVTFRYNDWIYDGILNNIEQKNDFSGNPVYTVTLVDPRNFLDGVQLILNGYTGGVYDIPNLYNIYGQLESVSFGNSGVNDVGISWSLLRNTFANMVLTNPMRFCNDSYYINLDALPTISDDYRIPGNSITLLGFIQDVCEAGGHDFFIELISNTIYVRTVSRRQQPDFGKITEFLASQPNVVSKSTGFELEYNTTSKMVVGGQVEQVYYQFFQNYGDDENNGDEDNNFMKEIEEDDEDRTDDTIWPYFGLNSDGTPVLINSIVDGNFTVNGAPISVAGRDWSSGYPMDIDELRCAADSQESWENYIIANNYPESIHYQKANRIGLFGGALRNNLYDFLIGSKTITEIKDFIMSVLPRDIMSITEKDIKEKTEDAYIQLVYDFVKTYATEFYGRKFMVRIPFVYAKRTPETNEIKLSLEPCDSGYMEESVINRAVNDNMAPIDLYNITDDNNKITPYVRFSRYEDRKWVGQHVNLSKLSESDYFFGSDGMSVFVKCSVESNVLFLNRQTLFSPRVVITLPGPVYYGGTTQENLELSAAADRSLKIFLAKKLIDLGDDAEDAYTTAEILFNRVGSDALFGDMSPIARMPDMVATPLRNNTLTYGPWYKQGAQGKVEFEQNENLVPWNFGGFEGLNLAGWASVDEAYSNKQVSESGFVELPGAPTIRLGGQLISGGPYVTDIQINFGAEGVTTTYRMNSWQVKPGKALRYNFERLQRMNKVMQEQKRAMRSIYSPKKPFIVNGNFYNVTNKVNRNKPTSTHEIFVGEVIKDETTGFSRTTVGSVPFYHFKNAIKREDTYKYKAASSLDAIFRPFTTDVNASGIAKFERHVTKRLTVGSVSIPTVNASSLNPFKFGHDIGISVKGTGITNLVTDKDDFGDGWDVRALALRGPVVITGWGYDRRENPVPSSYTDGSQDEDVLKKSDTWKTGPLDARWNDTRKVWVGGDFIRECLCQSTILPGESGVVRAQNGALIPYWDQYYKACLITEHVTCYEDVDGFYKPVGSQGLTRPAIATQTITPGGTGLFTIYGGNIGDSAPYGKSITASTSWLIANTSVSGIAYLQNCVVSYFGNSNNLAYGVNGNRYDGWQVIAARCE